MADIIDIENAVDAADRAFKMWSKLTPFQRGGYLRRASEIVLECAQKIARFMTQEQGKPLSEAIGEVRKGAEILRYYAEVGERIYGKIIPNAEPDTESRVIYQPIGVAVGISLWNYPIELLAWKLGGHWLLAAPSFANFPLKRRYLPSITSDALLMLECPRVL